MSEKRKQGSSVEPHLEVFQDRSVLVYEMGQSQTFNEGVLSPGAQRRLHRLRGALDDGFLPRLIERCKQPDDALTLLSPDHLQLLTRLVDSITSQVGRALVGLTVLQLCVKAICPEQSIRLHKGGARSGRANFSWREGVPMRTIDKSYVTPVLREHGLLSVNADGIMMTRTLAENYPYSKLYKAAIRGARDEWVEIVDLVENGRLDAETALKQLIVLLLNKSEAFQTSAQQALMDIGSIIGLGLTASDVIRFLREFVDSSDYSARVFEVALHSLFQALEDCALLEGFLKPLSQMRSANKKHGNVGDVELTMGKDTLAILEAWDAKYGKPYLRDELEELNEKLENHPETRVVGFVVDRAPDLRDEILHRMHEIEQVHNVEVQIVDFEHWVSDQLAETGDDADKISRAWLIAFAESLCQRRRERAPIDEPADAWVTHLSEQAHRWMQMWAVPS